MTGEASEKPVQERSRRTRAALLDAALECLVERGYADTTVSEVAKKAGVSRGAQLHHFPTKAELLTAAVGHLIEQRIADLRKAFANLSPGVDQLDASIDLLWSTYQGPSFIAWTELWVAARTDEALRVAVIDMDRKLLDLSRALYAEMFPGADPDDVRFQELGLDFAFRLMQGVALTDLVPHDYDRPPVEMILALKAVAQLMSPTQDIAEEEPPNDDHV
jgi:AcrR family transcriptional regulator